MAKSIFLHFLDSELQHTLVQPLTGEEIRNHIMLAVLSAEDVYASVSHILAMPESKNVNLLNELQRKGFVKFLLAGVNRDNFLKKHQARYRYYSDKIRYPYENSRYSCFITADDRMRLEIPNDCICKKHSASEYIRLQIREMIQGKFPYTELQTANNKDIVRVLKTHMPCAEQALTIAAFRPYFYSIYAPDKAGQYTLELQKILALFHNKSLMMEDNSSILYNTEKCSYYNILDNASIYDAGILRLIFAPFLRKNSDELIADIQMVRKKYEPKSYYYCVEKILSAYRTDRVSTRCKVKKYVSHISIEGNQPVLYEYITGLARQF